ncbi:phosphatase PAP2 family protein [Aeromonas diversa]|uniref:Phosphatidic acid phosphatase type 2/haloperoxidase domain-containing protein n=1 Tax=Aeromonas diversa CDC 2478-85 TaxID=1268237 RepID=N9VLG3_9GAMM|nr:phosphatase PAP2 family protein [Aeromonas diversa]ENY72166.1 hypothetical protein G114_09239 [Aeromonas diversa CDC 2478-85]
MHSLPRILIWNLLGAFIAMSWLLLPGHGIWARWDFQIFHLFNALIAEPGGWRLLTAITNNRLFDLVFLLCMLGLLFWQYLHAALAGRRRLLAMGLLMVVTAFILNRIGHLLPFERPSPTLSLPGALRLTELVDFPTKDASSDSFPGDHGLMLMIFAGFMLRFAPRWIGLMACLMVPLFTLPRIMAGAHWFTDIYMGSLAITMLLLPWLLLTPLAPALIRSAERGLARLGWLTPVLRVAAR